MAVKLGQLESRPVTRETAFVSRGRPVLITLEANGSWLGFREKGTRRLYRCPVEQAFWCGVKVFAAALKAEKQAARRRKPKG